MTSSTSSELRNPYLRANSLSELLAWDDVDFVRCAYVTVLGRQPDPKGEQHYTAHLRRGTSKLHVLWWLRSSNEARSHDPGLAGFDRTLRRAKLARTPVVGALVRLATGIEGETASERRTRALLNAVGRLQAEQSALVSRVDNLAGAVARVEAAVASFGAVVPQRPGPAHSGRPSMTEPAAMSETRGKKIIERLASVINASHEAAWIREVSVRQRAQRDPKNRSQPRKRRAAQRGVS